MRDLGTIKTKLGQGGYESPLETTLRNQTDHVAWHSFAMPKPSSNSLRALTDHRVSRLTMTESESEFNAGVVIYELRLRAPERRSGQVPINSGPSIAFGKRACSMPHEGRHISLKEGRLPRSAPDAMPRTPTSIEGPAHGAAAKSQQREWQVQLGLD